MAIFLPLPSFAFNYNYIISDKELEQYDSMTVQEIKDFLSDHNSFLQYYADFYPEGGAFMPAADIIWQTARQFHLNPKFLLTLLEKEQGLISLVKPSMKRLDWAMGYAVCDKCRLSHPLVIQYKGFAKQIYSAAEKIRADYLSDIEQYGKTKNGFGVGITKKVDKVHSITPANKATAVLYTYTPHIAGNQSFYVLWKNWFSNLKYPEGSLLQDVKSGGIYLIENGRKRPFLSKSAFTSRFNENQVVQSTPHFLSKIPDGAPIEFDNHALLRDENRTIYLLSDEKLRPFDSLEVFKALGFALRDIVETNIKNLSQYMLGEPIIASSVYPNGSLIQLKSGGVYLIYNNIKHPIIDKSVLNTLFPKEKTVMSDESRLEQFTSGEPLKFKDGTLVMGKTNTAVYFISNGKLRPIPSEEVFLAYNWKWNSIVKTTDKLLGLYETGEPITLDGDSGADNAEAIIAPEQNEADITVN